MTFDELADKFMASLVLGDEDDIDAAADALIWYLANAKGEEEE